MADDSKRVSFVVTPEAVKRVIAPYVNIVRYDKTNQTKSNIEIPIDTKNFFLEKRPSDLVKDLTSFLTNRYDVTVLNETAQVLRELTKSAGVTLYIVDPDTNELVHSSFYTSDQFSYLRWNIEEGTIVAAYVALNKECLVIDNILTDDRFPNGIAFQDESVRAVLCVPVVTCDSECYAVIELYRTFESNVYSIEDLKLLIVVTGWMALALNQYQLRTDFEEKVEVNNFLLSITKTFIVNTQTIDQYISTVLDSAKTRLSADRSLFYIIDQESIQNDPTDILADVYVEGTPDSNNVFYYKKNLKVKLNEYSGIAGYVAVYKKFLNVKDAYSHPYFNKDNDLKNGYLTISILCMPICSCDKILGIIEIINKNNGKHFTEKDEKLFLMFSSYFELALNYTNTQKMSTKKDARVSELKRILAHQLKPSVYDYNNMIKNPSLKVLPTDFDEFHWYITPEYREFMPHLCLHMILSLNRDWAKDLESLSEFILTVRDSYKDVYYHNYEHAFNVMHCIYCILQRNLDIFTDLEAMVIAALCHDIDHPGFTNQFINLSHDPMSILYDKSPLENHHFYLTSLIIEKTKVFNQMPKNIFKAFLNEIQVSILDTDLVLYFQSRAKLYQICSEKQFNINTPKHRELLKSIMMTASDLSGQSKPYAVAKILTKNLYNEFYIQAEKERQLGVTPLSMMDPEKKHLIPQDQVQFLTVVCIPCTELLKTILPNTAPLYQENLKLKNAWMEVCQMENKKFWKMDKLIPNPKITEQEKSGGRKTVFRHN